MYIYCANEHYIRVFGVSYGYPMVILWLSYGAGRCMKVEYKHAAIGLRACDGTVDRNHLKWTENYFTSWPVRV